MNVKSLWPQSRQSGAEANSREKRSVSWVVWTITLLLLIASSIFNVLLSLKTRQLRDVISTLKAESALMAGTQVPAIVGEGLAGRPTTIRFSDSDKPTLIYVFTPTCGWCRRNEANLKSLLAQRSDRFRSIAVSLAAVKPDDAMCSIPGLPVYKNLDRSSSSAYRFAGTPETILVSSQGTVLKVWRGAYMGEIQRDIESFFEVKLPGITGST